MFANFFLLKLFTSTNLYNDVFKYFYYRINLKIYNDKLLHLCVNHIEYFDSFNYSNVFDYSQA